MRDDGGMKAAKLKPRSVPKKMSEVRIRGKRVPDFGGEFVVVRRSGFPASFKVAKSSEDAGSLLKKVGNALNRPGINKDAIFKRFHSGVFAYSADPADPDKIVRRSVAGKKTIGRLVRGRFKAS
jgi:hypothetical protein